MTASSPDSVTERFAATLARTLTMPAAQLRDYQNALIARLLTFASQNSDFYRERLKPVFRSGDEPDLRAWHDIPVLRRTDLVQQIDRINPVRTPAEVGPVSDRRTSGSTGQPMTFRTCWLAQIAAECMMHRHYRWHGIDIDAPMASIRYFSLGTRRCPDGVIDDRWTMFGAGAPHHTLDVREPTECIVNWLERCGASQLITFPSLALDLCAPELSPRVRALNFGNIVGISETITDHARAIVRQHLGWEIAQIYACAEMGCIALQSPFDRRYLICEETVLVEILDEADGPMPPGQSGRVVLTSLYNYATPFIRYDIGDYATLSGEPAQENITLRALDRVEGRARNHLIKRDGRRISSHQIPVRDIAACVGSEHFQIRQNRDASIEIAVAVKGSNPPPDPSELEAAFTRIFGQPTRPCVVEVDELKRTSGGKREMIVSDLAASVAPEALSQGSA